MASSPVQIGPIKLTGFEVPAALRFGGRHRVAVHRLSSGERVIERLGPDDTDISFQGAFTGPDAEMRVRLLNNLRLSGDIVWLSWESFRHRVVVKNFVAEYRSPWWISYQISCVPVDQEGSDASVAATIASAIAGDIASATLAAGSLIDIATVGRTIRTQLASNTTSTWPAAVADVTSETLGRIRLQALQHGQPPSLNSSVSSNPRSIIDNLNCQISNAQFLAVSADVAAYLGRILKFLSLNGGLA